MKQIKHKEIPAKSTKTVEHGLQRIEAILNDYDPFEQNKIISETVKTTAIKRLEDDELARKHRRKTESALEEFVKQNPGVEKLIVEIQTQKERTSL